jgi:hypothetical protein
MTTEYTTNFALAKPDFRMGPWHDLLNANADKLDSIIFGALSSVNTPPWANNTAYAVGVTVLDGVSATTWMCNVAHTSAATGTFANDRAAHPTYWVQLLAGFAPRGQWTNNTNYFPYDLVYDSHLGIMALCQTHHTSNPSGNIKDDATFWAFLIDMSGSTLASAVAVTYSNASSGIPKTNVQDAIDYVQTEIVSLNNVNITQGNQISTLQTSDSTQTTNITGLQSRMTTAENTNNTQDTTLGSHNTRITAIENTLASGAFFAAGTVMLFYQATAPVGWTKLTTQNDKVLRVVSGTTGGGGAGTIPFSVFTAQTVVGSTTLSAAQMPSHQHSVTYGIPSLVYMYYQGGTQGNAATTINTGFAGSSGAHNHTLAQDIQYIDVILASKN